MNYRREIDGLRAIAVLPVILFHAGFNAFSGGFVGVDVFFVISGYLITSIILFEKEAGTFSLVKFYERRARRILPALFIMLVACVLFAWSWLLPSDMKKFSESVAAVSIFASNILLWQQSGYFDTAAELKPLLHTWTLAVEEQYYLLFPLFIILTWRLGKRWIVGLLAVAALFSLAAAQWGAYNEPASTFYLLPTRGWELAIGALTAFLLVHRPSVSLNTCGLMQQALSALGLALIAYAVFAFNKNTPLPSLYTLIPTVGTALVIICAAPTTLMGRLLGSRALVGIGLISYSAYLWHQPMFAFFRLLRLSEPSQIMRAVLVFSAVVLSYFSWRYIEKPCRNREKVSGTNILILGVSGSLFFFVFGLSGYYSDGYSETRFGEREVTFRNYIKPEVEPKINCIQGFFDTDIKPCLVGAEQSEVVFAAIGDSHLGQWIDVLDDIGRKENISFIVYSKASCASATLNYYYEALHREYWECTAWKEKVLTDLEKRQPSAILLTASSAGYVKFDGGFPSLQDWRAGVGHFIGRVSLGGRKIFWLIDNPRFWNYNPWSCYERSYILEQSAFDGCKERREKAVNKFLVDSEIKVLSKIENVTIIDFTNFYCDGNFCNSIINNMPVMRDSNHLTRVATFMREDKLSEIFHNTAVDLRQAITKADLEKREAHFE
jgi:peptidoglycan/LPS O-acetylase OafA/YrhL